MGPVTERPSRVDIGRTYERIAADFAATRDRPWGPVRTFIEDRPAVTRALDLGCGNGRHFAILADPADQVIGLDFTRELLEIAAETSVSVALVQGDAVLLPLRADSVDLCLYIATVHHLPSRDARQRSLAELARVLRPDGVALVSAWSVSHPTFDADCGHDRYVDWTLPDGNVVPRFYHIFDGAEFRRMLEESPAIVERTFERDGNWYGVIRGE